MQQVGGSIGLATLSTVAVSAGTHRAAELGAALHARAGGGMSRDQLAALQHQIALQAQTHGATRAFLVAAAMALAGALIVLVGLNVSHETVANDGQEAVPVA
jgi:threonine aldolase